MKRLDRPPEEHVRAAIMVMNFMRNMSYLMEPKAGMTDSDYSGNKDSRLSILGYIVFLRKVDISWRSKAQKSVMQCVQEILFVRNLLESIGIQAVTPAPWTTGTSSSGSL